MRIIKYIIVILLLIPNICYAGDRKRVAVVLGGGGAKGAAEVGVLKYIEQAGVPVDYVVGTSIGSIVGGLYSIGYNSTELDSLFRSQEWLDLLTDRSISNSNSLITIEDGVLMIKGIPVRLDFIKKKNPLSNIGVLRGDSIVSKFNSMIGSKYAIPETDSISFDSLPIPYRCVAVNVRSFEECVLSHGSLSKAMRASMAVPFVFRPMNINDQPLVDGGVLNNLPVDVAKAMGADIVIAVDLAVKEPDDDEPKLDADELFEPLSNIGIVNMIDWQIRRPDIKKYKNNRKMADLVIQPRLNGFNCQDFTSEAISEMISIGENAGREALPALIELRETIYSEQ